ncbi:MAG: hypothetical protein ACKVJK_15725, partial [Methylophagaceae bacterium]
MDNFGCEYSDEICVNVLPELIHDLPNDLFICDQVTSASIFNLLQNEAVVLASNPNPGNFVVTFHNSELDAENDTNAITNLTTYDVVVDEVIFIRFEYLDSNCFEIETFQLNLLDAPDIFPADDMLVCDDLTNDGTELFGLSSQEALILGTQSASNYEVSYYTSFADADTGSNALPTIHSNISSPEPIFVRVEGLGGSGCYIASTAPLFNLIVNNKATALVPADLVVCDDDYEGFTLFDFTGYDNIILNGQDSTMFSVTYYSSQADADIGSAPLLMPFINSVINQQTIYVRVEPNGFSQCYETTQFDLIVDPLPSTSVMTSLSICDDDFDGFGDFTLTNMDTEALNGQTDMLVSYHATQADADAGSNALASPYTNTIQDAQTIHIRLENTNTLCFSTMPLGLVVNSLPVPVTPPLQPVCDDDFDGFTSFDFTGLDLIVIGSQTGMVVSYHASQSDAETSSNALSSPYTNTEVDTQTIFIRLETTATGCYATTTLGLEVYPLPVVPTITDFVLCDDTGLGDLQEEFDLSTKDVEIINGQNTSISYYVTQADADAGTNMLANLYQNTSSPQILFVSLTDLTTSCRSTGSFTLIVDPLPFLVLPTPLEVCDDGTPDEMTQIDLSIKDEEIRGGNSNYSISYYLTQLDADSGTSPLTIPYTNISNPQTIFVRGQDITTGCSTTTTLDL